MARRVFPVPVPPCTTVALARGRPPPSIASRPATPVDARSPGEIATPSTESGLRTRGKNESPEGPISKKWRPVT